MGEREDSPSVERTVTEPTMAAVLRLREEDRRVVTIHLLDGSQLMGQIEDVAEDGSVAEIVNGRDSYTFDVSQVVVMQTRRTEREVNGSARR